MRIHNDPTKNCNTRDKFWDAICKTRSGGLFAYCERTYLKIVPGGWLMRQLYFWGRKSTSSAILFFHDPQEFSVDFNFDVLWEVVNKTTNPNYNLIPERFKTPEEWVVKEFLTTKPSTSNDGVTGLSLTYIPDPQNSWEITPCNIKTPAFPGVGFLTF
jgi:hypothetical protein